MLAGISACEVALFQCYITVIYMTADPHYVLVFMYVCPGCLFCFQPHKSLEFHRLYLVCV